MIVTCQQCATKFKVDDTKIGPRGVPLVIENGGPFPVEHDSLGMGRGKIIGHFRALKKK